MGFNSPLHRTSSLEEAQTSNAANNSLSLIREEIAIMKKLNHNNLVALMEVLDDPQEDSLYMVLEMCKKGVVMKVGLEERAEPYEEEACRCWFRDMILGIEYLHAQGIIHRDIKPDNCLITNDDVLKIVDFGVSEMFEKQSDMATAKSAGSPAFMPPELCVARHGQISGRAADIWSMGVTLYCLRYGHIPFEKTGMLELYESIRSDEIPLEDEKDASFEDLIRRMLAKEPERRITMDELREHPWVTKNGTDPLLSKKENTADLVEPPTEAEMNHAITGNMANLLVVMKAVKRFKRLLFRRRPTGGGFADGIFGRDSRIVTPPRAINSNRGSSKSIDAYDRKPVDSILVTGGIHRDIEVDDDMRKLPSNVNQLAVHAPPEQQDSHAGAAITDRGARLPDETDAKFKQRQDTLTHPPHPSTDPSLHRQTQHPTRSFTADHAKGHAHDPLMDTLFLDIGPSASSAPLPPADPPQVVVSESPPAVDLNIYEQAYQDEMKRILGERGDGAGMYLTRRVEHREDLREHSSILDSGRDAASKFAGLAGRGASGGASGLAGLIKMAKEKAQADDHGEGGEKGKEEDGGDAPLQAPTFDGAAGDATHGDAAQTKEEVRLDQPLEMPGGFPLSPSLEDGPP